MKRYTSARPRAALAASPDLHFQSVERALVSINISWYSLGHGAGILQVGLEREDRQAVPCTIAEVVELVCALEIVAGSSS